eukprot:138124-Hanusia_phi.AAC.2
MEKLYSSKIQGAQVCSTKHKLISDQSSSRVSSKPMATMKAPILLRSRHSASRSVCFYSCTTSCTDHQDQ